MVNVEPKLRPLAPKSPEPPPPPEKIETREPDAPKLTAKPKNPVAVSKPEPKRTRPTLDTSSPVKDVPQETQQLTANLIVPSDPRLSFWASRVKKMVDRLWSPPAGIEIEGRVKVVVSFDVARDGSISSVSVTGSSGSVTLNQLAERTILRLEHVPPIPENFPKDLLQVNCELYYQGQ